MNVIKVLLKAIAGDPRRDAEDKLDLAQKQRARCIAESQFHHEMVYFFARRVDGIDPHQDWHAFATAKQKWFDHSQDAAYWSMRESEAYKVVNVRTEQLNKLFQGE